MGEWNLVKLGPDIYSPADGATRDMSAKVRAGEMISGKFRRVRNPKFHRKFFALLGYAYERWSPGEIDCEFGKPEKNFDRFRHDVVILAGFYTVSIRLDGSTRVEPKSISFASMGEDEFGRLFNNVLNVLLKRIPQMTAMGADEVNKVVDQLVAFG